MKTFKAHTKYTKLTKSTRCACVPSGMRIFFETEEHKNRLYLWTYVTFVLMSKKQVATPLLSAKPSVSVPEVSTSDSKCALRKSVVSARNNNPR